MGKPKKCDFRPDPFIQYTTTTTSTTTPQPEDFSNYIHIPVSGLACPTTTTTTTTTTSTTPPPFDPNFPCVSYSFLPSDSNGAVITFAPCQNNNSLNQIVVGSIQRLDFCAERTSQIKILSGNGRLVYNGGCNIFINDPITTTTTTTTTSTTTQNPLLLVPPISLDFEATNEICYYPLLYHILWWIGADIWPSYFSTGLRFIVIVIEQAWSQFYAPDQNDGNLPNMNFFQIYTQPLYDFGVGGSYKSCCPVAFCPPSNQYFQFRAKITRPGSLDSPYTYSRVEYIPFPS